MSRNSHNHRLYLTNDTKMKSKQPWQTVPKKQINRKQSSLLPNKVSQCLTGFTKHNSSRGGGGGGE